MEPSKSGFNVSHNNINVCPVEGAAGRGEGRFCSVDRLAEILDRSGEGGLEGELVLGAEDGGDEGYDLVVVDVTEVEDAVALRGSGGDAGVAGEVDAFARQGSVGGDPRRDTRS